MLRQREDLGVTIVDPELLMCVPPEQVAVEAEKVAERLLTEVAGTQQHIAMLALAIALARVTAISEPAKRPQLYKLAIQKGILYEQADHDGQRLPGETA